MKYFLILFVIFSYSQTKPVYYNYGYEGMEIVSRYRDSTLIVNKTGMWVTAIEYDTMSHFNDYAKVELKSYQLGPDILEKYAGYIAGMPYGI